MSDYNVIVETDDSCDDTLAGNFMRTLCEAYPGHPWHLRVGSGAFILKHMNISAKWAEVGHYRKYVYDAARLKRLAIAMGGVILERAGLKRGEATGERPVVVEGIPDKDRLL